MSQDGQRPFGERAAFTAARPIVPRLHLAGLVPQQQHGGASSPEQQLRSPAASARHGSPRQGSSMHSSGRTPRAALQSSRLATKGGVSDKPVSDLWSMAMNHISIVLHGGEAPAAVAHNKQPATGLDAATEDALMSYLYNQILSRQEAKRTFVDGRVTEKPDPVDTRDFEVVLQDARATEEQPAEEEYDQGPPSARYWRTVNQVGSTEEHFHRLQQKKDVHQDLRVWADEVLSGRLLHELDMRLDDGPQHTPASPQAAAAAAPSTAACEPTTPCSSKTPSSSGASSGSGISSKETQAPPNTARGLRADLKAQIDAQVESEIDRRIAMARSQWELNFKADLGLLHSMKEERTQLRAELAAATNQLKMGGLGSTRTGKGGQAGALRGNSPLSLLGSSRRSSDAVGCGYSTDAEGGTTPSDAGRSATAGGSGASSVSGAGDAEAAAALQEVQQQLADALQQLADVHEVMGSLVREVESSTVQQQALAAQLQQVQQRAELERAAKDAALEQMAQLYSQLAAAQQLAEQNQKHEDTGGPESSCAADVAQPACDAAGTAAQQQQQQQQQQQEELQAKLEAEQQRSAQLEQQLAALQQITPLVAADGMDGGEGMLEDENPPTDVHEEVVWLRIRLAAAKNALAQATGARDAADVGREDAMQALERATQDHVRLGKQLRAATAAAEAAGAAPWQQEEQVEPAAGSDSGDGRCSCCAARTAELQAQLEQAKQQLEALQTTRGRSRAATPASARADASTSAKPSLDGAAGDGAGEQRSAAAMLQQWQEQQQWQQWQQDQEGDDDSRPLAFGVFGSNIERMHGAWGLHRRPGNATAAHAASASMGGSLCTPPGYRVGSAPSSPRRATVCGPQAIKVALQSPQYNTAAGQMVLHMHLLALQEQEQLQSLSRRLPVNVATLMQLAASSQATGAQTSTAGSMSTSAGDQSPFSATAPQAMRHSVTTLDVDRATGTAGAQAHVLPPSYYPPIASSPLLTVRSCGVQQAHAGRPASASCMGSLQHNAEAAGAAGSASGAHPQSARARRGSLLGSTASAAAHSSKVPLLDFRSLQQQQA